MIEDWVEEEYASLDLGDARLNRRAKYFVSQAAGIGNSNPDRCRSVKRTMKPASNAAPKSRWFI